MEESLTARAKLDEDRLRATVEKYQQDSQHRSSYKEQIDQFSNALREENMNQVKQLQTQIESVINEKNSSVKENRELQKELQRFGKEIAEKEILLQTANENVARLRKLKAEASDEKRELEQRFDRIRSEKRDLEYSKSDLEADLERQTQQLKTSKSDNESLRTRCEEAERTVAQLERWKQMKAEEDKHSHRLKEEEAKGQKLNEERAERIHQKEVQRLETDLTRIQKKLDDFEDAERKRMQEEIARLRRGTVEDTSAATSEQVKALEEQIESLTKQLRECKAEKSNLQFIVNSCDRQKRILDEEAKLNEERRRHANEEIVRLTKELHAAKERARAQPAATTSGDTGNLIRLLRQQNNKLTADFETVKKDAQEEAIKSCSKMIIAERRKVADTRKKMHDIGQKHKAERLKFNTLLDFSRNLKKTNQSLEESIHQLNGDHERLFAKIAQQRERLPAHKANYIDSMFASLHIEPPAPDAYTVYRVKLQEAMESRQEEIKKFANEVKQLNEDKDTVARQLAELGVDDVSILPTSVSPELREMLTLNTKTIRKASQAQRKLEKAYGQMISMHESLTELGADEEEPGNEEERTEGEPEPPPMNDECTVM